MGISNGRKAHSIIMITMVSITIDIIIEHPIRIAFAFDDCVGSAGFIEAVLDEPPAPLSFAGAV